MSINLTDKQYLMLSQLAYLDTPDTLDEYFNGRRTLGQMIEELRANGAINSIKSKGGITSEQFKQLLETIKSDSVLSNLTLMDYKNDNGENKDGYSISNLPLKLNQYNVKIY